MARLSRSVRKQLQLMLDDRGEVLPYVNQTDSSHSAVGWYVVPFVELADCNCPFCTGEREGADVYIGYHSRDAMPVLHRWTHSHETAVRKPQTTVA